MHEIWSVDSQENY